MKYFLISILFLLFASCANIVIEDLPKDGISTTPLSVNLSSYSIGSGVSNLDVLDYQMQEQKDATIIAYTTMDRGLETLRVTEINNDNINSNSEALPFDISFDAGYSMQFDLSCNNTKCSLTYIFSLEGMPNPITGLPPSWQCQTFRLSKENWIDPICNTAVSMQVFKSLLNGEDIYSMIPSNIYQKEIFLRLNGTLGDNEFVSNNKINYTLIKSELEDTPLTVLTAKEDLVFQAIPPANPSGGGGTIHILSLEDPYSIYLYKIIKSKANLSSEKIYKISNIIESPDLMDSISINNEIHILTTNQNSADLVIINKSNGSYGYTNRHIDLSELPLNNFVIKDIKYSILDNQAIINIKILNTETQQEHDLIIKENQLQNTYISNIIEDNSLLFADVSEDSLKGLFILQEENSITIKKSLNVSGKAIDFGNKIINSVRVTKTGSHSYTASISSRDPVTYLKKLTVFKIITQ